MKNNFLILLLTLIISNSSTLLSKDFAYIKSPGMHSIGIFQPYSFNLNKNLEFSTHPLLFLVKPNIKIKVFHKEKKGLGIATRFSLDYTTHLLRLIQGRGYFNLIAEDPSIAKINNLIILKEELLLTKVFITASVTGKVGFAICPNCNMDRRYLIDYDLIYPRMAILHYGSKINLGLDWEYYNSNDMSFLFDIDLIFLPKEKTFLEHKLLLHYSISKKYIISGGYKFSYGYYPFSKHEGLWNLFPLIDIKMILKN